MDIDIYKELLSEWMSSIGGGPQIALIDFGYAVAAAADNNVENLAYHWESLQSGAQNIADMDAAELESWEAEAATRRYQ